MKNNLKQLLDFEIDKLTNSIENALTGDCFSTNVLPIQKTDLKLVASTKDWLFDWKLEYKQPERNVYKLCIVNNSTIIQGLISLEIKPDHVYMHLLENAPFNKGQNKVYLGVAGNLVAFACKLSFQHNLDGFVSFASKTNLIEHYTKSLGAKNIFGQLMVIDTNAALTLMNKYF